MWCFEFEVNAVLSLTGPEELGDADLSIRRAMTEVVVDRDVSRVNVVVTHVTR